MIALILIGLFFAYFLFHCVRNEERERGRGLQALLGALVPLGFLCGFLALVSR